MARASDRLVADWRQRLRRYSKSDLTVAQFCSREGVSVPSFYSWKKRLEASARSGRATPGKDRAVAFQAITLVGPSAPVVRARLPGGIELHVCVSDAEVIRSVVGQLVRADNQVPEGDSAC